MGMGVGTTWTDAARKKIFADRAAMTIKTLICPSRRSGGPYANKDPSGLMSFKNQDKASPDLPDRTMRAISATETIRPFRVGQAPGRTDCRPGNRTNLPSASTHFSADTPLASLPIGVSIGLSRSPMAYRKRIASGKSGWESRYYENGLSGGDDQSMYSGMDRDNLRWARGAHTITAPATKNVCAKPPMPDSLSVRNASRHRL